jgi:hypothetical protein
MSRILTVSDDLYARLETAARQHGFASVEQLLERWESQEQERACRAQVVEQVHALRAQLLATYGEMPDSTLLIRQDRER